MGQKTGQAAPAVAKPLNSSLGTGSQTKGDFGLRPGSSGRGNTGFGLPGEVSDQKGAVEMKGDALKKALYGADDPGVGGDDEQTGTSRMDRLNRDTSIAQGAMGLGALAYNIFSNRTPMPKPKDVPYQPIDLRTDALASELDGQRQTATASASRNTQDKQGIGRDMAIAAQDQSARRSNTMQVEQVENQERGINHAGQNAANQQNVAQQNAWSAANAQANDAFRLQKGQAVSMALGQLGQTAQSYFQSTIDLETNEKTKEVNRLMLSAMSGDPRFNDMSSSDILMMAYGMTPTNRKPKAQ